MAKSNKFIHVLVIVDVQNDFCPGGTLAVERGHVVAGAISNHLNRIEAIGMPYDYVVTTQDWHIDPGEHFSETPNYFDTWPVHCKAGTHGADLHPALKDAEVYIDERFYKGQYSASYSGFEGFNDTKWSLGDWLRQKGKEASAEVRTTIVGIATDYCVKATALDAAEQGFKPVVIWSLTAPVNDNCVDSVQTTLRKAGVTVYDIKP